MRIFRSPVLWGILVGIAIGYSGFPVPVPNYARLWVWHHPTGFRIASIFVLGTLGYMVGSFIQQVIKARRGAENVVLASGISALALLIGLVGFYRFDAANTDTMWSQVRLGLSRASGAAINLSEGKPTQETIHSQGTSVIMAAADIGSASLYFGRHSQEPSMQSVSSALSQAGYQLSMSQNPKQAADAIKFLSKTRNIIDTSLRSHNESLTPESMQQVLNQISAIIPSELQQSWPAN